jgi:hypothetical protein
MEGTAMQDDFSDTELGKPSPAVSQYTPSLLFPIERSRVRASLPMPPGDLPFEGLDLWTAWELSWLDRDGKPALPHPLHEGRIGIGRPDGQAATRPERGSRHREAGS